MLYVPYRYRDLIDASKTGASSKDLAGESQSTNSRAFLFRSKYKDSVHSVQLLHSYGYL